MDDYGPDILTVIDDDGNEQQFEVLDRIETEEDKIVTAWYSTLISSPGFGSTAKTAKEKLNTRNSNSMNMTIFFIAPPVILENPPG